MNNNIQIYSPDKFGFYQVGEYKTYSRIEAIECAAKNKKNIHWNYNDEVFLKVDFSKEIDVSLNELYKLRCRQIRNSYDYVVLFYSGGSDSHNMLMQWINSECKLDEVATLVSLEGSKVKDSYANIEQYTVAIPNIITLSEKYKFDYTVIDFSKFIMDYLSTNDRHEHILYDMNFNISPNNIAKSLLRHNVDKWKNLILSGKKVCFLWGMEKLVFNNRNGNNYLTFNDAYDNVVSPIVQRNYNNGWYDEFFCISPDLPELMIKQCNIIKNFFKIRNTNLHSILSYYQQKPSSRGYNKLLNLYLSDKGYQKLMYPYWDVNTFSTGKSPSSAKSRLDDWIWDGNMIQKDIFLSSYNNFQTKLTEYNNNKFSEKFISTNEYII